jgi:hypothetical protein
MDSAIEYFEERAAILEFDAGRTRREADVLAVVLTRRFCKARGIPIPNHPSLKAAFRLDAEWDDDNGSAAMKNGRRITR